MKWKRWLKWTLIVMTALLITIAAYLYYLYHSIETVLEQTYEPIRRSPSSASQDITREKLEQQSWLRETSVTIEQKAPVTILLLGIDEKSGESGRSDTIMLLTVNPNKKTMLIFNIPRDTRTEIIGKSKQDKINHAFAFGGVDMAINTVEAFLQVPIDYYIKVNMREFIKVIDELGGVDVHNELEFTYEDQHFDKGELHLNGERALAYCRMRYDDPKGDLGRNQRQRAVVRSLMEKAESAQVLTKLDSIFQHVSSSVKTNLTFEDTKELLFEYREAAQTVDVLEVKGKSRMLNNIYYYFVSAEERKRITTRMKEVLELPLPSPVASPFRLERIE
ncbi:MAG: LCP family protein [Clostridia bacterium]